MEGDRIEIRDLRVVGVHGVLAEERERAQPFALDLDVWVDLSDAGSSDDLADTVDYGDLVERSAAVVRDQSFQLLEALAANVARTVLAADARVQAVEVTLHKLRPPIGLDVGSTGVRVLRQAEDR
jgi:dihydroneopterin aldolase